MKKANFRAIDEPQLHLNHFNGPLALLLHLIRKSKMSIYNIRITSITNQYIAYLKQMPHLNIDAVGDFLVMATKLMLIKSRWLLPRPQQRELPDPRIGLVNHLVIYQRYRRAAVALRRLSRRRRASYTRPAVVPNRQNHLLNLTDRMSVRLLQHVFRRVIKRRVRSAPATEQVTEWRYSVPHQAHLILARSRSAVNLNKILSPGYDLERLITNFLAILSLVKQQRLRIYRANRSEWLKFRKSGGYR